MIHASAHHDAIREGSQTQQEARQESRQALECRGTAPPETFNFLIGLHLESRRRIDGVLALKGKDSQGRKCLILWRNLSETDNTELETWFARNRAQFPGSFDLVYVNGDHALNALKQPNESWTAKTIEPNFRELMFERSE